MKKLLFLILFLSSYGFAQYPIRYNGVTKINVYTDSTAFFTLGRWHNQTIVDLGGLTFTNNSGVARLQDFSSRNSGSASNYWLYGSNVNYWDESGTFGSVRHYVYPTSALAVAIYPYGASAGQTGGFGLLELAANGTAYVGFKAPDNLSAALLWTLPGVDGASGQFLQTNGAGTLTWAGAGAGGAVWSALTNPTGNLSLNHGTNTSTMTWGIVGTTLNAMSLVGAGSETSTGALLNLQTGTSSTQKPISITVAGTANGVQMSSAGILAAIGTGQNNANRYNGNAVIGSADIVSTMAREDKTNNFTATSTFSNATTGINLGVASTTTGTLSLYHSTSAFSSTLITQAQTANRTFQLPTVAGTSVIATVDGSQTFSSSTWQATPIARLYGGTGITTSGSANQVLGMNAGASSMEYKTITGTTNQIDIAQGVGSVTASLPANVTITGKMNVAGITTQSIVGQPQVIDTVTRASMTASVGSTSFASIGSNNGMYRVSYNLFTTTAGTGGTCLVTVAWNNGTAAQSLPSGEINLNSTTVTASISGRVEFYVGNTVNPTWSTTVAGATGSPQYRLEMSLERIY